MLFHYIHPSTHHLCISAQHLSPSITAWMNPSCTLCDQTQSICQEPFSAIWANADDGISSLNSLSKSTVILIDNLCLFRQHDSYHHSYYRCYHLLIFLTTVIKSPRYTGGDFMFLYRFVCRHRRRRRRRRPQLLVHAITFEQLFGFISFWARLLALTCRLPD